MEALTLDEASLARMAILASVGLDSFIEADVRADIPAGDLLRVPGLDAAAHRPLP